MDLTPSPFIDDFDSLADEFSALCKKHNFTQWVIFVSEPFDNDDMSNWQSASNCASEGMVSALENMAKRVEERLNDH